MSDPERDRFKEQLKNRRRGYEAALRRFDESEAAYHIIGAGGTDVTGDLADLEADRQRVKAQIAELDKQMTALK